jgi:2-iminobutanoate/2-iminopropanoate deaminase
MRTEYSSGLGLEQRFGYSRAVAVGDTLYTSATAPVDANLTVIGATAYDQALHVFAKLKPILDEAGFAFTDVVIARIYTVDTADLEDIGRAFAETFAPAHPALTVVHVEPYGLPELRLEVELVAVRTPAA